MSSSPQGFISAMCSMFGATFSAAPCIETKRRTCSPTDPTFRSPTQAPRAHSCRCPSMPHSPSTPNIVSSSADT